MKHEIFFIFFWSFNPLHIQSKDDFSLSRITFLQSVIILRWVSFDSLLCWYVFAFGSSWTISEHDPRFGRSSLTLTRPFPPKQNKTKQRNEFTLINNVLFSSLDCWIRIRGSHTHQFLSNRTIRPPPFKIHYQKCIQFETRSLSLLSVLLISWIAYNLKTNELIEESFFTLKFCTQEKKYWNCLFFVYFNFDVPEKESRRRCGG